MSVNINHKTGIRYGVISQHAVSQAWADSAVADYGEPSCPGCGRDLHKEEDGSMYCSRCGSVDRAECYGEEVIGWSYLDDGYELVDCLDSDIMVIDSPFYTFAPLCSPCCANAGNLDDAAHFADFHDEAILPRTYCLGHDWFEDGQAPYPVYGIVSQRECFPDAWYGRNIVTPAGWDVAG